MAVFLTIRAYPLKVTSFEILLSDLYSGLVLFLILLLELIVTVRQLMRFFLAEPKKYLVQK
jgi:hypothetical protein